MRLRVANVCIGFKETTLIDDINFSASAGETIAIMGRSGSGKSTLLWSILGLLKPLAGKIYIDDDEITAASARRQSHLRRTKIGVVFQNAQLVEELSPVENVMTPLLLGGMQRTLAESKASEALDALGVPRRNQVSMLSGGELQRVAIARALVDEPSVIIADEPTAALDEETAAEVISAMVSQSKRQRAAIVLVTHSSQIASCADRILRVVDGHLIEASGDMANNGAAAGLSGNVTRV